MSLDIAEFLRTQKQLIEEEKLRIAAFELELSDNVNNDIPEHAERPSKDALDNKENEYSIADLGATITLSPRNEEHQQNAPLVEKLDLSCVAKEDLAGEQGIDFWPRSDDLYTGRRMLRHGVYSPNNPQLRVSSAPYLGLGEYEQRKHLLLEQRQAASKELLNNRNERIKSTASRFKVKLSPSFDKSVQTDIQNITSQLIQYVPTKLQPNTAQEDLVVPSCLSAIENLNGVMHNNRSPVLHRLDQRISAASILKSDLMEKPRGILTNRRTDSSPRERLLSDLKHSYVPNSVMDGFTYTDRADDVERERIKREIYQNELRLQIEEKKRFQAMREEQERREQELENRRLEQQLLRMQEEQLRDEQRRTRREQIRRNSDDFATRKQEIQSRAYRKHTDSESSVSNMRSTSVASKLASHYSPPVARRNPYSYNAPSASHYSEPSRYHSPRYDTNMYHNRKDTLNRMDSLTVPLASEIPYSPSSVAYHQHHRGTSFSRYDSLSRIDSLKQQEALNRLETLSLGDSLSRVQRRHSATQQDLSMLRRSPKLQRRSSSSRFEDSLPIPLLKAHSPVARELKNSVAVNSTRQLGSSDAMRKFEDRWQMATVQKRKENGMADGTNATCSNILSQLGDIRAQMQRHHMRMNESLRKRAGTQSSTSKTER